MAKRVGYFKLEEQDVEKEIWGDVFKGDEDDDNDVMLWGIVKWNISKTAHKMNKGTLENVLAEFERETGIKIKTKKKSHKYGGKYHKFYIPRPVEKMSDILQALNDFETDYPVSFEMEEDDFDRVKRGEIAKAI